MPAHPKPTAKAKKHGAMKTKPKTPRALKMQPNADSPMKVGDKLTGAVEGKVVSVSGQTKGALIRAMLSTPGGATSKEMEAATGWQPHSVRGFLGTLRKGGVKVISKKLPKEPTIYRIEAAAPEATAEVL